MIDIVHRGIASSDYRSAKPWRACLRHKCISALPLQLFASVYGRSVDNAMRVIVAFNLTRHFPTTLSRFARAELSANLALRNACCSEWY